MLVARAAGQARAGVRLGLPAAGAHRDEPARERVVVPEPAMLDVVVCHHASPTSSDRRLQPAPPGTPLILRRCGLRILRRSSAAELLERIFDGKGDTGMRR